MRKSVWILSEEKKKKKKIKTSHLVHSERTLWPEIQITLTHFQSIEMERATKTI